MFSLLISVPKRGVRSLSPFYSRAPWPFGKNKNLGQRKIGPIYMEKWKWPGQNNEFPELTPDFLDNNDPALQNYYRLQPEGYTDPNTKEFVVVPEMKVELVVPNFHDCNLKPYVSYKTDAKIQQMMDENRQLNEVPEWPPKPVDSQFIFDIFYAPKIREKFFAKKSIDPNLKSNENHQV